MKQEAICHYTDTPLTLPRGGHAASRQHYQYPQMTRKNLSVPSKRVETLPLARCSCHCTSRAGLSVPSKRVETLPLIQKDHGFKDHLVFQYPQSGSRPCRGPDV